VTPRRAAARSSPGGGGLPTGINVYGRSETKIQYAYTKAGVCLRLILVGPTESSLGGGGFFPLTGTAPATTDGRQALMVTFDLSVKYRNGSVMAPGPWQWLLVAARDPECPPYGSYDSTNYLQVVRRAETWGRSWSVLAEGSVTVSCGGAPISIATKVTWMEGTF